MRKTSNIKIIFISKDALMSSVKFIDDEDGFQFGEYCDGRTGGIIKLAAGAKKKRARPRTSDLVS